MDAKQTCAWCGKDAYRSVIIEAARVRANKTIKQALTAPVCEPCAERFAEQGAQLVGARAA